MRLPRRQACDRSPAWSGSRARRYRSTSEPRSEKSLPRPWARTADRGHGAEILQFEIVWFFLAQCGPLGCAEDQVREGIIQRKVPPSILLSGLRSIPPRRQGVPAEALLLHDQPNPGASVGDGIS